MFAYCVNNPVVLCDPDGTVAAEVATFFEVVLGAFASLIDGPLPVVDIAVSILIIDSVHQVGSECASTTSKPTVAVPIVQSAAQGGCCEETKTGLHILGSVFGKRQSRDWKRTHFCSGVHKGGMPARCYVFKLCRGKGYCNF